MDTSPQPPPDGQQPPPSYGQQQPVPISNRQCMDNNRRQGTHRQDIHRLGIHRLGMRRMDTPRRPQRALAASGGHRALGWIRMSPQDLGICSPS